MIAQGPTAEVLQSDVVRQAYLGDVERRVMTAVLDLQRRVGGLRAVPRPVRRVARGRSPARPSRCSVRTASARPPSPGWPPGSWPRPRGRSLVDGVDMTGAPVAPLPAGRHHPRARGPLGVRHPHASRRTSCCRSARPGVAREVPAALDQAFTLFPALGQPPQAARRHAVGRRAADARRWPGCWSRSRSCWSPTSCRSGWRRSSSTRSTRASSACAAAGTALLIVEQHVGHALALCDRVVLLDHGAISWEGPAADAADRVVTAVFATD